ncbi:unnamed protein product [Angiostrongylus costaricensis]|uniref:ANF_receptor domain-containing protein n=1 Tax=Angiostrongylus costaricensis TaxID=334426 RepID=A0A158PFB5_ANGCS|nr:unnamed protein product [Angiostrongylus costaricensis]
MYEFLPNRGMIMHVEITSALDLRTTAVKGTVAYENIRYGVERWNSDHSVYIEITLQLIATDLYYAGVEERTSDFVTNVGPHAGLEAMAISALLENLRWTSFLLVYQHDSEKSADLVDLAPLIHDRRSSHYYRGTHAAIRMRRLPSNTNDYQAYLKYVRNYLQETNIVIHSNNITTLYSLLQSAKVLNMTESPFSYLFTSTVRTVAIFYRWWNPLLVQQFRLGLDVTRRFPEQCIWDVSLFARLAILFRRYFLSILSQIIVDDISTKFGGGLGSWEGASQYERGLFFICLFIFQCTSHIDTLFCLSNSPMISLR